MQSVSTNNKREPKEGKTKPSFLGNIKIPHEWANFWITFDQTKIQSNN